MFVYPVQERENLLTFSTYSIYNFFQLLFVLTECIFFQRLYIRKCNDSFVEKAYLSFQVASSNVGSHILDKNASFLYKIT